jgi:ribonuclease HI
MPEYHNNCATLFFDGGSRGNPGIAAGAAVVVLPTGEKEIVTKFLDRATNNDAEYTGLIIGLQKAKELGITKLAIKGDSNLVVNQVLGKWKVNHDRLRQLCHEAQMLYHQLQEKSLTWIPREQNKLADTAVNQCLDSRKKSSSILLAKTVEKIANPATETVTEYIQKLISLGDRAKQNDYRKLKSGRDSFTSKNIAQLKAIIPENIRQEIDHDWEGNEQYLAKVYRWFLRGLPPEMAKQKVISDAETEAQFTGKHPWKTKA